jgi:hypothetical protein
VDVRDPRQPPLVDRRHARDGDGEFHLPAAVPVLQFLSYTTKTYTTFGVQTESTYDWTNSKWTIPLIAPVSQLLKIGGHPISLQAGPKLYVEGPSSAPDWGIRFAFIFLFPEPPIGG